MKKILVYTVHKAASMFLHKLSGDAAKAYGINYYSINQDENFERIKKSSWMSFINGVAESSGCFGPIRAGEAEPNIPDDLGAYSSILHLRDPRDVLVSLYFSNVYSHPKAGGFSVSDERKRQWAEHGIDTFVLERCPQFRKYYQGLIDSLFEKENVVFVKYETMVLDYAAWLKQFMTAFECLQIHEKNILSVLTKQSSHQDIYERLYKKHKKEFAVSSEDLNKHKRQITPGDYKRKLLAETIEALNDELGDVLDALSYDKRLSLAK